jgi:predicted naringenin-chalcone synthase
MKVVTNQLKSPSLIADMYYPRGVQIVGVGTHSPRSYSQAELVDILGYTGNKVVDMIVQNAAIDTRSFYKTPLDFGPDVTSDDLSEYHREFAPLLAAESLRAAAGNHFDLDNLDALIATTSTGFMSPGIAEVLFDTYHIGRLDTSRYNLVGHGCVGTIPAVQIAQSLILSGQARYVGVVCTELVAALFNPFSRSKMNIIQQLIFGEGGAAVILGDQSLGGSAYPVILDSQQGIAPDSINAVVIRQRSFWEGITDRSVPSLVGKIVPGVVQHLLDRHGMTKEQVRFWSFHTGGRKILEECQSCLELSESQMTPSYETLLRHGNMLSASVLFSFERLLRTQRPQAGDMGVLVALGPGITAGAFLMRWEY